MQLKLFMSYLDLLHEAGIEKEYIKYLSLNDLDTLIKTIKRADVFYINFIYRKKRFELNSKPQNLLNLSEIRNSNDNIEIHVRIHHLFKSLKLVRYDGGEDFCTVYKIYDNSLENIMDFLSLHEIVFTQVRSRALESNSFGAVRSRVLLLTDT